jgi:hypothetical protein
MADQTRNPTSPMSAVPDPFEDEDPSSGNER